MRVLGMAVAAILAGCAPPSAETAGSDVAAEITPANNCSAAATGVWSGYAITATTRGADCAQAEATIVLTDSAGTQAWSETYSAAQVFTLAGAEGVEDMQRSLNEWIQPPRAALDSAADLPEWAAEAETPASGEFPFYVDEGVTRQAYAAARASDAPMFCYTQGMESLRCLIAAERGLTTLGVQSFPG